MNIRELTTKEEIQEYENSVAKFKQRNKVIEEISELEQWFVKYDRICNEHARCQRLGIECHHNINEWDVQAVEKAKRLKELRDGD